MASNYPPDGMIYLGELMVGLKFTFKKNGHPYRIVSLFKMSCMYRSLWNDQVYTKFNPDQVPVYLY